MRRSIRSLLATWALCVLTLVFLMSGCGSPPNPLSGTWTSMGTCAYGEKYDTITQVEFLTSAANSSDGTIILDLKTHGSQSAMYALLDDHRLTLDHSTVIPFSVVGDTLTLRWDPQDVCTFHRTA